VYMGQVTHLKLQKSFYPTCEYFGLINTLRYQ
jgi:hypothetical protein